MGAPIVHVEIGTKDSGTAAEFYRQLFGWTVTADETGYGLIDTGADEEGIGGGIMPTMGPMEPYVTFYVGVDDLAASLADAERLGGTSVLGPTPVPGVGAFALFTDPDGNVIGLLRMDVPA